MGVGSDFLRVFGFFEYLKNISNSKASASAGTAGQARAGCPAGTEGGAGDGTAAALGLRLRRLGRMGRGFFFWVSLFVFFLVLLILFGRLFSLFGRWMRRLRRWIACCGQGKSGTQDS